MSITPKPILLLLLAATIFTCVAVYSCKKSDTKCYCENNGLCINDTCACPTGFRGTHCDEITCPVCYNNGICNNLTKKCVCPAGYEGTGCEIITRSKFIGNWYVFEKGSISPVAQYPIRIDVGSGITDIVIKNFNNYFMNDIRGYITGDTLYIPNQQLEGKIVFGIGYIYSNPTYGQDGSIKMRYEVIDTATNVINDYGFTATSGSNPSEWNK